MHAGFLTISSKASTTYDSLQSFTHTDHSFHINGDAILNTILLAFAIAVLSKIALSFLRKEIEKR